MNGGTKQFDRQLRSAEQQLAQNPFQAARNWSDFLDTIAPVQTMNDIFADLRAKGEIE